MLFACSMFLQINRDHNLYLHFLFNRISNKILDFDWFCARLFVA